jgi:hypothetical protein
LLVPATMRLIGNLNWWLPFIGVQGPSTPITCPPDRVAINLASTPLPSSPERMESHEAVSDTGIGGSRQ